MENTNELLSIAWCDCCNKHYVPCYYSEDGNYYCGDCLKDLAALYLQKAAEIDNYYN